MPTPSDPTAVPAKSYEEMANAAQAAIDEQNRAVRSQCEAHDQLTQFLNPHGDCLPLMGVQEDDDGSPREPGEAGGKNNSGRSY